MTEFLIIYIGINYMFTLGVIINQESKIKLKVSEWVTALLIGWTMIPIALGIYFGQQVKDLKSR